MDDKWKWVVMVAVYATNLIGSATSFSAGIIYVAILERYGGDKTKAAAVLSLNSGLLCILGPITTSIVNRYSCRVALVIGGVFLATAGLLSAFVNSVELLMVTYGILGGIGNSLTLVPASLILCFYFTEHRNRMIAISNGVIGLAMLVASPMTIYFLDKYALCGLFLIFGALNAHICIAGMISRPSSLEKQASGKMSSKTIKVSEEKSIRKPKTDIYTVLSILCSKLRRVNVAFIFFLFSTLAWNVVLSVCIVHLPNFALINEFSNEDVTLLMTCLSINNIVGRFLPVLISTKSNIDITLLHTIALGAMGVVSVTFPSISSSNVGKYFFSASAGLLTGLTNSLMTPITIKVVGLENISTAHGFAYFFCGIGFLLGPTVAGFMYGLTGSYKNSFIFAGIISISGCMFALASRCTMRHKTRSELLENVAYVAPDNKDVLNVLLQCDKDTTMSEFKSEVLLS